MSVSVPPSLAWKLVLAAALLGVISGSQLARPPSRPAAPGEVRRLMFCALGLYAVGMLAFLTGRLALAALVLSAGIAICALASWLARGEFDDPPDGAEPGDAPPPSEPDGLPPVDWTRFEADLADYAASRRRSPPAGSPR